jgi:hypothetical protein
MRTTVTLDPDTRVMVERLMKERGLSFKEAVNEAIRRGLAPARQGDGEVTTVVRSLGTPRVDLTKALALAGELEDEALARRASDGR